ncbi:MAG TPA: helix-turn-helix domain-containing protein [bacterium]|nr:helix-turn-helix domain-containing protein [bacterium]
MRQEILANRCPSNTKPMRTYHLKAYQQNVQNRVNTNQLSAISLNMKKRTERAGMEECKTWLDFAAGPDESGLIIVQSGGMSQREVAKKMGISRSLVFNIERSAIKKLKGSILCWLVLELWRVLHEWPCLPLIKTKANITIFICKR